VIDLRRRSLAARDGSQPDSRAATEPEVGERR
jgi:hypothetical protein